MHPVLKRGNYNFLEKSNNILIRFRSKGIPGTLVVPTSASNLVVRMMNIEKQSNGSDCSVLATLYVLDICSGCHVRFDHRMITVPVASLSKQVMKWLSVMHAIFGTLPTEVFGDSDVFFTCASDC